LSPSLKANVRDGALTLDIVVAPRASRPGLGPVVGDRLRVAVAAPPVDGKANAAVIELLAKTLGVPRGAVEIVRGETGRKKTVRLRGVTLAAVLAACLE
jgi:uncharacterized protein (TIGR00251 family)